jgi:hypothetical protein
MTSSASESRRACPRGPAAASRKSTPQSGSAGPPPATDAAGPGSAVPPCVGAGVSGTAARPKHRAAANAARAPSTMTPRPTTRVSAAECQGSVNKYRPGEFHWMVPAASPRKTPPQSSKTRRMALSFHLPADSHWIAMRADYRQADDGGRAPGVRALAPGGSRGRSQGHRHAPQELAEEVQGRTPLLPVRPPNLHQDRLRSPRLLLVQLCYSHQLGPAPRYSLMLGHGRRQFRRDRVSPRGRVRVCP